jgi:hypothetical protein
MCADPQPVRTASARLLGCALLALLGSPTHGTGQTRPDFDVSAHARSVQRSADRRFTLSASARLSADKPQPKSRYALLAAAEACASPAEIFSDGFED